MVGITSMVGITKMVGITNMVAKVTMACLESHPGSLVGPTQPPTVVCKMEGQLKCVHVAYMVFARLAPTCMLSWCLLTKFLHRSSGGNLLRVRCWLGSGLLRSVPQQEPMNLSTLTPAEGTQSIKSIPTITTTIHRTSE